MKEEEIRACPTPSSLLKFPLLLCLLTVLFLLCLWSQTHASTDIVLAESTNTIDLSGQLLCTTSDPTSLNQLQNFIAQSSWSPCQKKDFFLNPETHHPLWLKLSVHNVANKEKRWAIEAEGKFLSEVAVYSLTTAERASRLQPLKQNLYIFPLFLGDEESTTLLIGVQATFFTHVRLRIADHEHTHGDSITRILIHGLFIGMLLIMLCYNLSLYFLLREGTYLSYCLYLLAVIGYILVETGVGEYYLWPSILWMQNHAFPLFSSFCFLTAAWFHRKFLRLTDFGGWVLQLNNLFLLLWILFLPFTLLPGSNLLMMILYLMALASLIAGLVSSVYLWWRGSLQGRQYTIAYAILYCATTVHVLALMQLIPWNPMTEYSQMAGFSIEFILLSLALVSYINQRLENKVLQRTDELQAALKQLRLANKELEKQSLRDPLTQLYNRRYFDQTLINEVSRASRNARPLAILMIDIDFFKSINDRFGHLQGDECLRLIAASLSKLVVRRNDFLARYGGEEFVILLPETHLENALFFAEKILQDIRQTEFVIDDEPVPLTVSIGIDSRVPKRDEDPNDLLASADQALYQAKSEGRNRACSAPQAAGA